MLSTNDDDLDNVSEESPDEAVGSTPADSPSVSEADADEGASEPAPFLPSVSDEFDVVRAIHAGVDLAFNLMMLQSIAKQRGVSLASLLGQSASPSELVERSVADVQVLTVEISKLIRGLRSRKAV